MKCVVFYAGRYAIFGGGSSDLPNPVTAVHAHAPVAAVATVAGNSVDVRAPLIGRSNVVDIYDAVADRWINVTLR